jgi:cell division septation protein DedD
MQVETLTRICPLCRRAADGEDAPPSSRLCRDCRVMLDPILPRAGLIQPDYAVALAGSATLQTATLAAPLVHDVDFDDLSYASAVGMDEDFALLNEAVVDDFDARPAANAPAETTQQAFVQQIDPHAPEFSITSDQYEDPDVFIAPDQYEEDDISTTAKSPAPAPAMTQPALYERADSAAEIETAEAAPTGDLRAEAAMPALENGAAHIAVHPGETDSHGLMVEDAAVPAANSADPWDDPLPAWEYSRNEWPLLVNEPKPVVASRLKWPLIGSLVIIACAVAAVYFFFIKPRNEASVAPSTSEASAQQPLTVPVDQPKPADAPPTAANATATANPATTADKNAAPPLASVSQVIDSQGKHALQAMASPNEGEANSFVERLKTAAIPAYVVRADLGSHGIWYRVRIGRFATPEEAQRFAAEARARARAVGVTLKDLQVTSFDKP